MAVWYDAEYRLPLSGFGKRWGFDPRRADLVAWYLSERRWITRENLRTPARARYEDVARVHTPEYLERLATRETLAQIFAVDPWDVPVDEVMRSVRLGVGGTLAAARASLRRRGPTVNLFGGFHHAGPEWGSGLCALNDMAVAVAALRHDGFTGRVVILDLDAHPPDGTAACLRNDSGAWIGSLSGAAATIIPGVDETVLPARCDDHTYLAALEGLLGRMPPAALALVLAGGDVLAEDQIGTLGLTLHGARARDLRVARALHGIPSVWLPGGGYHADSWRVLAGTVLALVRHTTQAISQRADPLRVRFTQLAGHLRSESESQRASGDLTLTLDDIEGDLGLRRTGPGLLLGTFTADAIEYALYRFNLLGFLERRGYSQFRVAVGTATSGGDRVSVFGQLDGREHLLIDCVLELREVAGDEMLYLHWVALRDPKGRFSGRRPRLPGQDVPGLGLAREVVGLLTVMAHRIGARGVAFAPAWYHTAYVARHRFKFVDPRRQGRFEAMLRDFAGLPLAEVSNAVSGGRVRLNGDPYTWEADDMAWRVDKKRTADPAQADERERSHFTIVSTTIGELASAGRL